MRTRDRRFAGLFWALSAALALLTMQAAGADELKPFEVSFGWNYGGLGNVAVSKLKLEQRDAQTWVYTSETEPRGLGKLFPERPKMESVLRVTPAGVQPLSYKATAGTASTQRDVDIKYDWKQMRVTGVYEGSPIDIPLKPGVLDDLSAQIALMVELMRGHTVDSFLLVTKTGVRLHHYTKETTETIGTKIGPVPAIVYRSEAEYSPRATRYWCAAGHGYIPMRVQQKKGDSIEWTMQLESFKRDEQL